jgi:glycogen debranching enzyme
MTAAPAIRALAAIACLAGSIRAQEPEFRIPKFEIYASPIGLVDDVRPQQYIGVLGRRAAWLGKETGEAELWTHPLKLASDFQLAFRIPDYLEPIRGGDVARTIETRPELTTITYTHATFTVRQHILAPLSQPGLLVLLDVETFRPLEIVASFQMVFQYAWPASFGGQYAFWHGDERAFFLSESLRERNAIIGSPWASAASSHPAHALPDAPNTFVIRVDTTRAREEFIPIAIAGAAAPRDTVLNTYRRLLAEAESLYREKLEHVSWLLEQTTSVDTPDDELDLAFAWSKINLDEAVVCNPDLGCGLVAGWGPSGVGTRPGFGWFFGGDAAINSFAMQATGLWEQVSQGLRFLERYQRDDGKIPHEISQAAAHIPWFTEFPYAYYHADTTPYWIVAAWRYWRATGDDSFIDELWPAIRRAYAWCLTRETDGDGIIENGPGNLGAIEIGALGEGMHQDIYLASVWTEALEALTDMAAARGDDSLRREAAELYQRASATLNDRYWREADGHHAFGILQSGGTNDNLTVWAATATAFGLLDTARADLTLTKLATDSITADWGARILSTGSPLYDPMHYNNGAVWPFVTGFVVWGQYNYRRPWSGYPLIDALKQVTFDWARGRHPELLSGRYYRPLDTAVPQQFFASSMLVSPVVMGILGWDPDAPDGTAQLSPQLPPQWDRVAARSLRVGSTTLDIEIEQAVGQLDLTVVRQGPPIELTYTGSLPADAKRPSVEVQSADGSSDALARPSPEPSISVTPRESLVRLRMRLDTDTVRISIRWEGGLAVVPPTSDLQPGQRSRGIRVLDFQRDGERGSDTWIATVEGESGRPYHLRFFGKQVQRVEGAHILEVDGPNTIIEVMVPPSARRMTTTIRLFGEQ